MNITQTQTRKSTGSFIWLALTGILTILGIAAWVIQLKQGVGATSLSNLEPWGIYIAGFIFFMGLSAGSLVLASLPILLDLPKFRPYARIAAFIALIALIAGGLFILVDIGKPDRLWRIIRFAHLGSPMLWDLLLTIAYLIISTVFLRRLMGSTQTDRTLKVLAWLALIAGVADMVTGFVFATQVAHEFWFSAVQPIAFLVAAVASAGAVALLVMLVLRSSGLVGLDCCDLEPVAGLTAIALGLDLLLIVSEIITLAFSRTENAMALLNFLRTSPLFWIEIVTALLAILFLSVPATRGVRSWVAVGSLLAVVDLAVKRFLFVQMGFVEPNIQFAGVAIAQSGSYLPSLVEWGLVVGLVGMFAMLLIVGFRTLPLGMEQKV